MNRFRMMMLLVFVPGLCFGGSTSEHWAFQPVERPATREVEDSNWLRNPIDGFVLGKLEAAGIGPSAEADRVTLIRRLSLDLLGLPPSPAEVAAFVGDTSAYAYERLVNRLLASPHFGERWGRHWLDLARYADSDGFEKDTVRPHAWRYRQWVIDALNRDLPYDRFIVEQLAGDLLPGATLEQRVATGFHRNTLTNREGGVDPEEFRVEQVVDRVNTTGAAIMGLTMACAQCHDHKYDPVSQREYFGMFAYFNSGMEKDISAPLDAESALYARELARWEGRHRDLRKARDKYAPSLKSKLSAWEDELREEIADLGWTLLEPTRMESTGGASFSILDDGSILVGGAAEPVDTYTIEIETEVAMITGLRLEVLTHESLPVTGPGRARHGNFILSEFKVSAAPLDDPEASKAVTFSGAWADIFEPGWPIEDAIDGDKTSGWSIYAWRGDNQNRQAVFTTAEDVGGEDGTTLRFTFDHQYGSGHSIGRFRLYAATGSRDHFRIAPEILEAVNLPVDERSDEHRAALLAYFAERDPQMRAFQAALDAHESARPTRDATYAQIIVENPNPPKTHVHIRGSFLNKGEEVQSHVPAVLPPLAEGGTRLDLAEWLVDPAHPLTARVAANRIWEKLFGAGLVETSEDFGTRGERPSHPKLLDWLAAEYPAQGWSTKGMIRLIVSSATYRQRSKIDAEIYERDPSNRLLSRQNRFRVEGETIRDLFLSVSGLMNPIVGGPSIRPALPAGVRELGYANSIPWQESDGRERYRRGLYIHFQRTVPYPSLLAFDCPDSTVTAIRRARSNTPLQALTLMNDPVFFECAQALARRVVVDGPEDLEGRMAYLFRVCLAREGTAAELTTLAGLWEEEHEAINTDGDLALRILGDYLSDGAQPQEAAPWVTVARAVMNLDEFVTRE